MSKQVKRLVNTSFWEDEKVVNMFSPEDKYFMLYLLTNPHTTQLGIYKLVPKVAAFELGYSVEAVMVLLDRFEKKYDILKYSPKTSEVAIKNFLRHSVVKGGKPVMDLLVREESEVKDKSLLLYIYNSINNIDNLNITVREYINHLENLNDNDNDNDNERIVDDSYHDSYHESSKPRKSGAFKPPMLQDVITYCRENNLTYVNPDAFIDFYDSKNWMVGKNKMSNWKSALSGWNRRAMERGEREYFSSVDDTEMVRQGSEDRRWQ